MESMADSFLDRIPSFPDAQLRAYLDDPRRFKLEAVEAAAAELRKRGHAVPEELLQNLRAEARERARAPRTFKQGFLRDAQGPRVDRIRIITGAIVAAGLGSALVIYHRALSAAPSPFDLEPSDSKSYLRQVEMMGGKANLVASGIRQWLTGLFQGTTLAYTVFGFALAVAVVFWLAATQKGATAK